jgi:hypothetical protein
MSREILVEIDRAVFEDGDLNLSEFVNAVRNAIYREYKAFGGEEEYDVWPESIYLGHVIVRNVAKDYKRAEYKIDPDGNISFANIQTVKRQFVPIEVERSETSQDPIYIEVQRYNSFWGSALYQ